VKNRNIYKEIVSYLATSDIIVIHGSRQVGKTTLLKLIEEFILNKNNSKRVIYMDLEDSALLNLCNKGPEAVLDYIYAKHSIKDHFYLMIDEIQYLEEPSSFLKIIHDHYKEKVKCLVSGSSSFDIKSKFKDSLVGRTVSFELFPLDFKEYLDFNNQTYNLVGVSSDLVHDELKHHFKEYVRYGGYPKIVLEKEISKKEVFLKQIISTYVKKDLVDIGKISKLQKYNHLLELLASQMTDQLNTVEVSNTLDIARQTVGHYIDVMHQTYVINLLFPYSKNIRTELSKMPKVFWEDTGLSTLIKYSQFINKIDGRMFENSIYTELRKTRSIDKINYWRTTNKQEIDFIIHSKGKIIPLEVKLSYSGQSLSSLDYYLDQYKLKKGYVITLEKNAKSKSSRVEIIYPWEVPIQ
jgi:uncharacterized protein